MPGPVTTSAAAQSAVPYANIAMAWAPPAACTSVTPSSAQAASTAGAGRPPCAALGGDATAISLTPATWAGMTFITTDDGYATRPPGTYTPARRTGTYRSVTVEPGASSVTGSAGSWASCTSRARRAASASAARTAGSSARPASASAAAGTRVVARSTPSNRAVYSRTAAAPRCRTSSHTGRTASVAFSTSTAARGSTPASFPPDRPDGSVPRRSMILSTGPA